MNEEYTVTLELEDIPIGYWDVFQNIFLQYEIYADHKAKTAVDIWFDNILT